VVPRRQLLSREGARWETQHHQPHQPLPQNSVLKLHAAQQIVWAAIWLDEQGRPRRSKLIIMNRDSDAPKRGYSAKSYMEALTKGLLPHWRRSQLFMQDGAGIHQSHAVAAFLQHHHINTID
jgi:hypothetical protein